MFEIRISTQTEKQSYETKLIKMTSHFQLLTKEFL